MTTDDFREKIEKLGFKTYRGNNTISIGLSGVIDRIHNIKVEKREGAMNTSLFVGLCEDAGLSVEFKGATTAVLSGEDSVVAEVSERFSGDYYIDTWGETGDHARFMSNVVPKYALTPIEERE